VVEHIGEVVVQAASMLITESEVWKYRLFGDSVSKKIWNKEYDSLSLDGLYHEKGRLRQLQARWAELAQYRLIGFCKAYAYAGDSKRQLRFSSQQRNQLRSWYERLKPICRRVREANRPGGDVMTAAIIFEKKNKTGSAILDKPSYLDNDLIKLLGERKSNRQYKYKPFQVAAVQAARLTVLSRGLQRVGINQAREIMRLLSKR
jgi:hypothetical protein